MTYQKRIIDDYCKDRFRNGTVLLIGGPRWCGKTTAAEHLTGDGSYALDLDAGDYGSCPAPDELVESCENRPFVFTSSYVPALDSVNEWIIRKGGNTVSVRMDTMSLFESGDSEGTVSLKKLFDGEEVEYSVSDMTLDRLAYLICRGGWPSALGMEGSNSLAAAKDFFESSVSSEFSSPNAVKRSGIGKRLLMQALSKNICSVRDVTALVSDMGHYLERKAAGEYLRELRESSVTEDIPSWTPILKSKARLRRSVKRNLTDPSIAAAALGIGPRNLLSDPALMKSLFESMCVRDLRVYSTPIEGRVCHYHDNSDLEIDSIIQLDDGRWGAIEIKLHSGKDQAAKNLLRLRDKIVTADGIGPSFLMILTGTGFAHVREDGVLEVPIGCLRD